MLKLNKMTIFNRLQITKNYHWSCKNIEDILMFTAKCKSSEDIWMFTTFILLSSSNKTCSIADKIMKLTELDPVSRQCWMTSMCWRLVSVSRWLVSESWSLRKTRLEWKTSVWCILADVQFWSLVDDYGIIAVSGPGLKLDIVSMLTLLL